MKSKKKVLGLLVCAVLLVVGSVMGTIAYLTADDEVVNTFTVGNISMTLDEAKVNVEGEPVNADNKVVEVSAAPRVPANTYKLMPGHEYTKDPTIHMVATSEDAWVFVKVENGIAAYESDEEGYADIAAQIVTNGWTALKDANGAVVAGVYYKEWHTGDTVDLKVFDEFTIDDDADTVDGWANVNPDNTKVNVTGYAVQLDGFEGNPAAAWDVVK